MTYTEAEKWQHRAAIRQGIISKLEKKLSRAEAEIAALRTSLAASNARLAMYDQREMAA
ncbi:hypothetical protein [Pseudarthrobacter sp. NamB4]|uniref:hypothetical protein n=1 Tax=Pseudarthrobacter sp. NamB4 TaxID=2576837 RepID=UPI001484DE93|nr:hypothetical protein [Pseudarthrobacter sp. NamB4]